MIKVDIVRDADNTIRINGHFSGATDKLIDELACLCANTIQAMAADYAGQDDITDQLERALVEAIIARHAQDTMPFEGEDNGEIH
mgnify:CR=1 FL=1|nr:MAG TPA: hypothetical protein [Bacteriophage sp.]